LAGTSTPELVEQFKAEANRVGTVVYEAKSAEDANNYVLKLAQEHNVKRVVKSKSMVTEEIELNKHLKDAGIEVTETDLGEYIVQLAGEKPSHLVGPAIHKTVEQVAELFSKATGDKLAPHPQALLKAAHRYLRQSIINANMGISGANIAIAETGTLVILDSEGNARLVATLPPTHVAMVRCEKLVPSLDDAAAILKLLSKGTTGQKMPSYVTYITGRSTTADIPGAPMIPAQGPEEVHIVLLDSHKQVKEFNEETYRIP
jgi:L-lactate utilization protein LutB